MRDYKSPLLILLSVLLLVSAGLLGTVLYHFYFKTTVQFQIPVVKHVGSDSTIGVEKVHDSLLKIYTTEIRNLEKRSDSIWNNADSMNANLDSRLSEFYKLRNEIKVVLKEGDTNANLRIALKKNAGLQERVVALRYTNLDVEKENKRLNELLNQLKGGVKVSKNHPVKDCIENGLPLKNTAKANTFLLNELRFSAIKINDAEEHETNKADQTEKLSGSFKIKNKNLRNSGAEIVIVVLQPDGKVMQNSAWDTGTFETTDGKKIYSLKLRFEYIKGESKQLLFSLSAEKYQQGNYLLKIYHNGLLIGKMIKTLS